MAADGTRIGIALGGGNVRGLADVSLGVLTTDVRRLIVGAA